MFYTAWLDTPNPLQERVHLSDPRTPEEKGAALVADGYLASRGGDVTLMTYNSGDHQGSAFEFKGTGQVVLFARHLIQLKEYVIAPGTSVSET